MAAGSPAPVTTCCSTWDCASCGSLCSSLDHLFE